MRSILFFSFVFAIRLNISSQTPLPDPYSLDPELSQIKQWTCQEHKALWSNLYDCMFLLPNLNHNLALIVTATIANQEMRKSLGFAPPGPWSSYNRTKPSDAEIEMVKSVEKYYELKEPNQDFLIAASQMFAERIERLAVDYFDKRDPIVRAVFKKRLAEVRGSGIVDRKMVDRMLAEFEKVFMRVGAPVINAANNIDVDCLEEEDADTYPSFINTDDLLSNLNSLSLASSNNFRCWYLENQESVWRGTFGSVQSQMFSVLLFSTADLIIGHQEIRKSLRLSPSLPRPCINYTADRYEISKEELDNAKSVEEYLNLKIRPLRMNGFSDGVSEKAYTRIVAFMDSRFPEIRNGYKKRFQTVREENGGWLDRNTVDRMVEKMKEKDETVVECPKKAKKMAVQKKKVEKFDNQF